MANRAALITVLIFIGALLVPETDAGILEDAVSDVTSGIEYVLSSLLSIGDEILDPPRNSNSSIQYELYTPESPQTPCYLEESEKALESCPFNSTYPLKVLIHGFYSLDPQLWDVKNYLLERFTCNVIRLDWRRYSQPPYFLASVNTQLVGWDLARLLQYLEDKTGLDLKNVHLIGHSLGAHVSGVAGKITPNLGRISGLDPAHPLFSYESLLHRLTYTDAEFVDVIHTSASDVGFGIPEPIGHQDFYPNGGSLQPQCVRDVDNEDSVEEAQDGNVDDGPVSVDISSCDHSASTQFFLESVTNCVFLAAVCDNNGDFQAGACSNGSRVLLAKMGLPAEPILGLGPRTKFFLRTGPDPPYCLEDGYEP